MKHAITLFIFSLAVFSIMSYWGIREPDSEVVFRTTEALATQGTFAVSDAHYSWDAFGLPKGKDGKFYSLFGPGEAIAAVPLYKIAGIIHATGWYQNTRLPISISHYTNDDGLMHYVQGTAPPDIGPHALRMFMGLFNIITASLCVLLFFFTVQALTQSNQAALLTSIVFAFGSLVFPYSGTCFSEPLATFFVMLSFYLLVHVKRISSSQKRILLLLSGLSLGLAAATHITAILFAPFFCLYGAIPDKIVPPSTHEEPRRNNQGLKRAYAPSLLRSVRNMTPEEMKAIFINAALFSAGLGLLLALIGYFNYIRFDSIFETGHTLGDRPEYGYGEFIAPWAGIWGFLVSAGKSLLLYCPAVILGLIVWLPFHKKHRLLSFTILAAAFVRIIFIASRSDWHGGFGVGPRLMFMLIPFLLLPLGEWINEMIKNKNIKAIVAFATLTLVCIAQQIYFSLGEIFSYSHFVKWEGMRHGVNVFQDNLIYLSWDLSPLFHLLEGKRGPLLLNFFETGNYVLWLILVLIAALCLFLSYRSALKSLLAKAVVADKKSGR